MTPLAKSPYFSRSIASLILIFGLAALASSAWTSVVMGTNPDGPESAASDQSECADMAVLERMIVGRRDQLYQRQKRLLDAIDGLGRNHPSVAGMKDELSEVEQQLQVWSSPTETLIDIEDHDLRVMVVQLMIRVDRLESRNREQQYQRQWNPGNPTQFGGGRLGPDASPRPR